MDSSCFLPFSYTKNTNLITLESHNLIRVSSLNKTHENTWKSRLILLKIMKRMKNSWNLTLEFLKSSLICVKSHQNWRRNDGRREVQGSAKLKRNVENSWNFYQFIQVTFLHVSNFTLLVHLIYKFAILAITDMPLLLSYSPLNFDHFHSPPFSLIMSEKTILPLFFNLITIMPFLLLFA